VSDMPDRPARPRRAESSWDHTASSPLCSSDEAPDTWSQPRRVVDAPPGHIGLHRFLRKRVISVLTTLSNSKTCTCVAEARIPLPMVVFREGDERATKMNRGTQRAGDPATISVG
jgi:hypothetical protein